MIKKVTTINNKQARKKKKHLVIYCTQLLDFPDWQKQLKRTLGTQMLGFCFSIFHYLTHSSPKSDIHPWGISQKRLWSKGKYAFFVKAMENIHFQDLFVPEDLAKLVFEVTAGGIEVVQVRQDTALSRGAVCRVHTWFHHDAQPENTFTHIIQQQQLQLHTLKEMWGDA